MSAWPLKKSSSLLCWFFVRSLQCMTTSWWQLCLSQSIGRMSCLSNTALTTWGALNSPVLSSEWVEWFEAADTEPGQTTDSVMAPIWMVLSMCEMLTCMWCKSRQPMMRSQPLCLHSCPGWSTQGRMPQSIKGPKEGKETVRGDCHVTQKSRAVSNKSCGVEPNQKSCDKQGDKICRQSCEKLDCQSCNIQSRCNGHCNDKCWKWIWQWHPNEVDLLTCCHGELHHPPFDQMFLWHHH